MSSFFGFSNYRCPIARCTNSTHSYLKPLESRHHNINTTKKVQEAIDAKRFTDLLVKQIHEKKPGLYMQSKKFQLSLKYGLVTPVSL